jgi:hypothetical protein
LHRPLITVPPALTGAAITVLALAEPFIAAGAAVVLFAVFYCFLKALMVSSYRLGMVLFCPSERIHPGGLQKKN